MAPETVFIYALNDPTTGRTRYVGKAEDFTRRYKVHTRPKDTDHTHKARAIENMKPAGGLIQSPMIDASGDPTQRSIKDIGQARDVVRTVIQASRQRTIVNS